VQLKSKVKAVCTLLGVGAHLECWGIDPAIITELAWWESRKMADGSELTAMPARHFSGRGLTRGKTFWSSFVLRVDGHKIFVGGDSGYDDQFRRIGEIYGPFDIAMVECGQYGAEWPHILLLPGQTATAARDRPARGAGQHLSATALVEFLTLLPE